MIKFTVLFTTVLAAMVSGALYAADVEDVTDGSPYYYQAPAETMIGAATQSEVQGDTDSGINHLPVYHGHMQTNNTYRMVNVAEQVFTMIGDGKHGVWRLQDNGTIREYLDGGTGVPVPAGFDLKNPAEAHSFAMSLSAAEIAAGGYAFKGPYASNSAIGAAGTAAPFLDIPIFHERYAGAYDNHPPIDLPVYYCTMSAPEYAKARALMDFAYAQPAAGKIGPLGVRGGLDIKENYPNVLRLNQFPDAKIWANTGSPDDAFWEEIDTTETNVEHYLVTRPFFQSEYLFLISVFDNAPTGFFWETARNPQTSQHSYIRPDGPYYDHLMARGLTSDFSTEYKALPRFDVVDPVTKSFEKNIPNLFALLFNKLPGSPKKTLRGFPLYGIHHPGDLTVANGACPNMGGDFGESYYGAAWPTNYQEITPLCDGIVVDLKFYANLDDADWDDVNKNLANNHGSRNGDGSTLSPGDLVKNYTNDVSAPSGSPAVYGNFSNAVNPDVDPYMDAAGLSNPDEFTATGTDTLGYPSSNPQVKCAGDDCPNSPDS